MSAATDRAALVRILVEASGIPLSAAEQAAAAERVDAKRAELQPLHVLAATLPAGAGTAVFRAGEING